MKAFKSLQEVRQAAERYADAEVAAQSCPIVMCPEFNKKRDEAMNDLLQGISGMIDEVRASYA